MINFRVEAQISMLRRGSSASNIVEDLTRRSQRNLQFLVKKQILRFPQDDNL
jgi:hypothetical protein